MITTAKKNSSIKIIFFYTRRFLCGTWSDCGKFSMKSKPFCRQAREQKNLLNRKHTLWEWVRDIYWLIALTESHWYFIITAQFSFIHKKINSKTDEWLENVRCIYALCIWERKSNRNDNETWAWQLNCLFNARH